MDLNNNNVVNIQHGKINFAERISSAETEFELIEICIRLAVTYGYTYFSILRLPDASDENLGDLEFVSNWPDFLISEYDSNNLMHHSPIIKHLLSSTEPIVFDTKKVNKKRSEDEGLLAVKLFEEHGISNGVYFSTHLPNGKVGSVSFCGNNHDLTDQSLIELNYLSGLIFSRINILRFDVTPINHQLSRKEVKSLKLLSHGHDTYTIAQELSLSENTVRIYLQNAMQRLDCKNIVQSVSKAFRLRIIE